MSSHLLADRYRLLEPIGQGGMGTVWRAEDRLLHRQIAIKEVRVARDLEPEKRDELLARTMREARISAGLSTHPSIVTIHDVVQENERPWIVMELVSGRGLDRVVAEDGPLSPRRTAEIGRQLFDALNTAHEGGVLHRDVKPANVMLLADGRALLSDFGIAVSDSEDKLTLTGNLPGSPGYVAPERLKSNAMTPAADVWSLGATLYFAVEGRPAFERPTNAARLTAAIEDAPDPAQRAGALRPVLNGMLQHDPEHRLCGPALDAALARVISGSTTDDLTPTQLDVSDELPVAPGGTGPSIPMPVGARMTASAGSGLGRRRWVRLLLSILAGLITLILAPLLVEYLSSVLIEDEEPGSSPSLESTAPDRANPARDPAPFTLPEGYTEHSGSGFTVAAPQDWSADDTGDGVTMTSPDAVSSIRMHSVDLGGDTPLEHLESLQQEQSDVPGFRSITLEDTEHPQGEAARWTYEASENGALRMFSGMLLQTGDGAAAMVVYSTGPDQWEPTADTRRTALESLRRS
ncbi:MAG: serine/threonine-protein kinase [Nocardiopsaceae bacterium]|nr:serine/threonine-protein kinase [Nocardiopsaceae bacterium]